MCVLNKKYLLHCCVTRVLKSPGNVKHKDPEMTLNYAKMMNVLSCSDSNIKNSKLQ